MDEIRVSISTVTPVYRGARYLENLVKKLERIKFEWENNTSILNLQECIFVIDECVDNSLEVLQNLKEKNRDWIRIIELSRNFGQHPSTSAGILHTSSDWVFTLDEDCQHDPKFMINFLREVVPISADICYAKDKKGVHGSIIRDKLARFFKAGISLISGNANIKLFNSYRLIRGDIARAAAATCRRETYFDIALTWYTDRMVCTQIEMFDLRNHGKSKSGYSIWGLILHSKRLVLSSKLQFLRIGFLLGVFSFVLSCLLALIYLSTYYFSYGSFNEVRGWLSLFTVNLFFGGIMSLMLSLLLEGIFQVIGSLNGKPTFFIIDRSKDQKLLQILE